MSKGTDERITTDTTVSTTELAAVLGLTARRIQQMIQDGSFPTVSRGRLNLSETVQKYIKLQASTASEEDLKIERGRRKAEASIKASKAAIVRMEAQELQGKMHRSEDVAAMTEDLIYSIRGLILAVPGRVAKDAAIAKTPAEAAEVVRKELYFVLKEISRYRYDPQKYEERVRERMDWASKDEEYDDE